MASGRLKIKRLATTESGQDNNKRVFECFYQSSPSISVLFVFDNLQSEIQDCFLSFELSTLGSERVNRTRKHLKYLDVDLDFSIRHPRPIHILKQPQTIHEQYKWNVNTHHRV